MATTTGPLYLTGSQESIFLYGGPAWEGAAVATINNYFSGGPYLITGQGVKNEATPPDQLIRHTVRVRNLGSAGSFRITWGKLN